MTHGKLSLVCPRPIKSSRFNARIELSRRAGYFYRQTFVLSLKRLLGCEHKDNEEKNNKKWRACDSC